MAEGKAAAVIARLGQINREAGERRALRERRAAEAKQQARESLQKQGPVAERATKHLIELAKRQRNAGGWVTEKALEEKENVLAFGTEDDEQEAPQVRPYGGGYSSTPAASPTPTAPAEPQQEPQQQPQQERKYARSVAPPEPEPEPAPPPPRPAPRPARPAPSFDDDDFSNNSWLK